MMGWSSLSDRHGIAPLSINVWALRKDKHIKRLLLNLVECLGENEWYVDTEIQMSFEAVYLVHRREKNLRAYLHIHGQSVGRAGLHLEYPRVEGAPPTYDAFENLELMQLVDMLAAHFGIARVASNTTRLGHLR